MTSALLHVALCVPDELLVENAGFQVVEPYLRKVLAFAVIFRGSSRTWYKNETGSVLLSFNRVEH